MKEKVKPVDIAIIGPGRQGHTYANILDELATTRLVAVGGGSKASTGRLAAAHGVPGYPDRDYHAMLAEHPSIEAVIICSSEWEHVAPALAAIEAGKHLLIEKPLAPSAADAAMIVERAEAAGVTLMVCHSLRFNPRYAAMRQAVRAGAIGEVLYAHARRNAGQTAVDRVLGKFPLAFWLMPHDLDQMLWTVDSPVVRVRAESHAGATTRSDFISATLTFANGVTGRVENSWGTPNQGGRPHNEVFSIYGTAGAAEVLGYENGVAVYKTGGVVEYPDTSYTPIIHGQTEGPFRSLTRHFAGVVRELWEPVITGRDGLAVIRVAEAINRSLIEGREVEV
jgi:UDP-N-acetylglucosamine 3-dehydrogenase